MQLHAGAQGYLHEVRYVRQRDGVKLGKKYDDDPLQDI
jgi:hypothetical protein